MSEWYIAPSDDKETKKILTIEKLKPKCIVVLSMHGSGSSLVASILDALGVDMRPNPKAKVRWYKNYEDASFVALNIMLLHRAGGAWLNPPSIENIIKLKENANINKAINSIVTKRDLGKAWGFKDPRTSLTISLIHPHLSNPHYIRVKRDRWDVAQSILKRGPPKCEPARWIKLSKEYNRRIDAFLSTVNSPVLEVVFDDLLDSEKSEGTIGSIAEFAGMADNAENALKRIDYKKGEK